MFATIGVVALVFVGYVVGCRFPIPFFANLGKTN